VQQYPGLCSTQSKGLAPEHAKPLAACTGVQTRGCAFALPPGSHWQRCGGDGAAVWEAPHAAHSGAPRALASAVFLGCHTSLHALLLAYVPHICLQLPDNESGELPAHALAWWRRVLRCSKDVRLHIKAGTCGFSRPPMGSSAGSTAHPAAHTCMPSGWAPATTIHTCMHLLRRRVGCTVAWPAAGTPVCAAEAAPGCCDTR
jgi:hypothetical protein